LKVFEENSRMRKLWVKTLDWLEKQLMEVRAFDMGLSINYEDKK